METGVRGASVSTSGASVAFPSRYNLNELKWALVGTCHRPKTTDLAHAEARQGGYPRAGY